MRPLTRKLAENPGRSFFGESSETKSHQCVVAWIIRQRERVKLRSWLTGSRLTWHRPETRFERSNRILAPQLRGYVRRKVRQPGGESRITRQDCAESGGGWGRMGRGGREKWRKMCSDKQDSRKYAATYRKHYIRWLFLFVVRLGRFPQPWKLSEKLQNSFVTSFRQLRKIYFLSS